MLKRASNLGKGLEARFDAAKIDDDNEHAVSVLKEWGYPWGWPSPSASSSIYLYGPVGTGKTFLACCSANARIDEGFGCLFLRAVDIPRNDTGMLERLWDPGFSPRLVLDDIGAGKHTPRLLECLYNIVDARSFRNMPTIYTSNYTLAALADLLDEADEQGAAMGKRLASRIRGSCEVVPVGGADRRE